MSTERMDVQLEKVFITNVIQIIILDVLLIVFVIILIRLKVILPISQLESGAQEIANGNLNQNIKTKGHDEIANLGQAFNIMTKNLKGSQRKVEIRIKLLDEKVEKLRISEDKERKKTKELKQALSERKVIEQSLIDAKRAAEDSSRAKSEFLANMSHEIRTPMNGVIGMTSLLLETEVTDEQKQFLEMVRLSGENLMMIINDILDVSKIEAGKLDIEETAFDLIKMVDETFSTLASEAHNKGLEIMYEIDPDLQTALLGDPLRIKQVIINLVRNAIKFTKDGHVLLKIEKYKPKYDDPDVNINKIHFSVEDTGIGIPIEKQGMIFEKFTQADGSTSRKYGGTGLGLSICTKLIGIMHGYIWIESVENSGTTFHFILPLKSQSCHKSLSTIDHGDLKGLRTLVVDDNEINRKILEKMLISWELEVTTVSDGLAALSEIDRVNGTELDYQLILLDHQMPGMDGLEVAERLRTKDNSSARAIMILTSNDQFEDKETLNNLGIAKTMVKPISPSELQNSFMTIISNNEDIVSDKMINETTSSSKKTSIISNLDILLAEDNKINSLLAVKLLEKLGLNVTTVENGLKAMEAIQDNRFDLVLMDVQMPEMDGIEATKRIRELERKKENNDHLPIIALTAHAMQGDKERFLGVGMDDYLSKPLDAEQLYTVIVRYICEMGSCSDEPDDEKAKPNVLENLSMVKIEELKSRLKGDSNFAKKMLGIYRNEIPVMINNIQQEIHDSNWDHLKEAAHTLKGASATVSANAIADIAQELEKLARVKDMTRVKEQVLKLEQMKVKTVQWIDQYLDDG